MKVNLLKGRLGEHRFHMILVHFPSALYPFALVMDGIYFFSGDERFAFVGFCALIAGVASGAIAMIYGAIDFMQLDAQHKAWKTAGLHALLNLCWLITFSGLLSYQIKYDQIRGLFLIVMTLANLGMIFSNYLGGELVIKHRLGIEKNNEF